MKKYIAKNYFKLIPSLITGVFLGLIVVFLFGFINDNKLISESKTKFYDKPSFSLVSLSLQNKAKLAEEIFGRELLEYNIPEYSTYKKFGVDSLRKNRSVGIFPPCTLDSIQSIVSIEKTETEETLQKILKTYPKNWVAGEISAVVQDTSEDDGCWADCAYDSSNGSSIITFYKFSFKARRIDNINCALSHELAHANDWQEDNNLLLEERLTLLLEICERIIADDRYMSSYVEHLDYFDRYSIVSEYWAEICQVYFTGLTKGASGGPSLLNVKDIVIIESIIAKDDPNYDVMAAYYERCKLITGYGIRYYKRSEYLACNWPIN